MEHLDKVSDLVERIYGAFVSGNDEEGHTLRQELLGTNSLYTTLSLIFPGLFCYGTMLRFDNLVFGAETFEEVWRLTPEEFKYAQDIDFENTPEEEVDWDTIRKFNTWVQVGREIKKVMEGENLSRVEAYQRVKQMKECAPLRYRYRDNWGCLDRISKFSIRKCAGEHLRTGENFGIYLELPAKSSSSISDDTMGHANVLWFDVRRKTVERYDPDYGTEEGEEIIDGILGKVFQDLLPEFIYQGLMGPEYCIQYQLKEKENIHAGFCQDYSVLYLIRRIAGMSHTEAMRDLASKTFTQISVEIKDMYYTFTYYLRAQQGLLVPKVPPADTILSQILPP